MEHEFLWNERKLRGKVRKDRDRGQRQGRGGRGVYQLYAAMGSSSAHTCCAVQPCAGPSTQTAQSLEPERKGALIE